MTYQESQIANFESCNVGVPTHLAISALVEVFTEGWDPSDLAALKTSEDVTSCEDWAQVQKSVAWDYAEKAAVVAAILSSAKKATSP
jgi:hypothetical protein